MNKYLVTFIIKGRKSEIVLGSPTASSAFQTAKLLFPTAFVVKAVMV